MQRLLVASSGMRKLHALPALLDDFELVLGTYWRKHQVDAVAVWGRKRLARVGHRYAASVGRPLISIEDGFLRSVGLGHIDPPLSIVVDDLGIYYDASNESRLERLIKLPSSPSRDHRAQELMRVWRASRISKYNYARDPAVLPSQKYVLVVDQTRGDASISGGQSECAAFNSMFQAALDENPECIIALKVHPDVLLRKRKGHFDLSRVGNPRVIIINDGSHPVEWIRNAEKVYVVTSQLGFEALLWGRPVRVFGMPFYAGWGLTTDNLKGPNRRHSVALEQLVHATLIDYPRYVDPESGKRCEVETVVAWMGMQRRMRARFSPKLDVVGFSRWKQQFAREFLDGSKLRFSRSAKSINKTNDVAIWGDGERAGWADRKVSCIASEGKVLHIEDGFLRSVGLGAMGTRPLSWAIDDLGMYYDPGHVSRLERILSSHEFDSTLIARAQALRERIRSAGLTKYNLPGCQSWTRPADAVRVILAPGQVEDDASLRYGTVATCRRNIDLLKRVRELNPDAFLIYRRHPDVRAGVRAAGVDEHLAHEWCDEIVDDMPFHLLLDLVDEVHVLTSLAGFEALIRQKPVVTYGQPFYAGWGLTMDTEIEPNVAARRHRRLALDELIAGTLICYPTYVSLRSRRFTTAEKALDELLAWRQVGAREFSRAPLWRRLAAMWPRGR